MNDCEALAATRKLLVALDFDGTLAPIVPRPEMAEIDPGIAATLARLSGYRDVELAVITGRDVEDVRSRLPNPDRFWISGGHGREIRRPDGTPLVGSPPDPRLVPFRKMPMPSGLRREVKSNSVAFHWRGRPEGEPAGWLQDLRRAVQAAGLEIMDGRMVAEVMVPGGGKAQALARIATEVGATGVFFAGDDRTDLEAIDLARTMGVGVFVASAERTISVKEGVLVVDGTNALSCLLDVIAQAKA